MGWETRAGRLFYYRKVRCGWSVVSEYVGTGPDGQLLADLLAAGRDRAASERQAEQHAIEQAEATDDKLVRLCDALRHLTTAILVQEGFHQHKGQWRRRRNERAKSQVTDQGR